MKQTACLYAFLISFLIPGWIVEIYAQKIELLGAQQSEIQYRLAQNLELASGTRELIVSFVLPVNFKSRTFIQQITDLKFEFLVPPDRQETKNDPRGNQIRTFFWEKPSGAILAAVTFRVTNRVNLHEIRDDRTPFPMRNLPPDIRPYLQSTAQVQSNNPLIQKKARELSASAITAYQAIRNILFWVVEHMQYILVPDQSDALYAFRTGKGNCQNYSHLAAALLRAIGIPARIVNGITLARPYSLKTQSSEYQFEMAQGRHSWIEVFSPEIGWIPFDPQQSEFFVSSRYVRIEVGLDNDESINDGLVRWRQSSGTRPQPPRLEEVIETDFIHDETHLSGKLLPEKLKKIFLGPPVVSDFTPIAGIEKEIEQEALEKPSPEKIDYTRFSYTEPFIFGNLDFPEGINFAFPRKVSDTPDQSSFQLRRSFLVETAEYVTSNTCFAQIFILEEPVRLEKIALALHIFGGSGTLWLELSEDENGKPGQTAVKSRPIRLEFIQSRQGYHWIDFDFSTKGIILSPGRYWFFLNYNGSPIVNWFYSYGKPIGPAHGTRSRPSGRNDWPMILSFEFNYRVTGKAASNR